MYIKQHFSFLHKYFFFFWNHNYFLTLNLTSMVILVLWIKKTCFWYRIHFHNNCMFFFISLLSFLAFFYIGTLYRKLSFLFKWCLFFLHEINFFILLSDFKLESYKYFSWFVFFFKNLVKKYYFSGDFGWKAMWSILYY